MGHYRIGEVSEHTSLSLRTIRYYEEEGLITSHRSKGGQRWYTDQDIVYLKRIIELKGLGFSLSEIRRIIELKAEDELLRVGMAKGRLACGMEADVLARLSSLGDKSWRRIFLHSADEGIYGYVTDGINEAKLPVGILDTSKVERFVDGAGGHGYVLGKRMVRKLDRGGGELPDLERGLCLSVLTVLQKMRRLCVRRSDFAELCVAMRFNDYNEDIVQAELRRLGAARPAARLLQILKERYGLGEGFMFAQPLDVGKTEVLRRKLFKSNIQ